MFKDYGRSILRKITKHNSVRSILWKISRAGILPPCIWKRLPVEGTFSVPLPNGFSFKYSSIAAEIIGRALFWVGFNAYEKDTVDSFYNLAQKSNLVLDIGANTGLYTLIACAANSQAQVVSFEPVPGIYQRLQNHIKMNGFEDRCQARNEAVSDFVGTAKFHVPFGEIPVAASLNTHGFRGMNGYQIEVPVTTIDDIKFPQKRVDLVKIDAELFEDKVLTGMERVLKESSPAIILECHPDGPYPAVESILTNFGYSFFHLVPGGPLPVKTFVPDTTGRYLNFLCIVHGNQG